MWRKTAIHGVECLIPADDETRDWLRRRKAGDFVAMVPEQVRNAARLAIYWIWCKLIAEQRPDYGDRVSVSDSIKILTGHFRPVHLSLPDGSPVLVKSPKSIAFASMREDAFEDFMLRAEEATESVLLPGVSIDDVRREAYIRAGLSSPS